MSGEKELSLLLASMCPSLDDKDYVFTTVSDVNALMQSGIQPKAMFVENEGTTLVLTVADAQLVQLPFTGKYRCITLNVHSSLEAVGLTAAVATALAKVNISANVIAAYYHDHIFVPEAKASQALDTLLALTHNK